MCPIQGRIIILLTDGANNSGVLAPLKAAELAKEDGIKIYTIGLGSEADPRALTSDFLIPNASADLDEETLKKMADMTGGRYFRATDTETLHSIYKTINQLETVSSRTSNYSSTKRILSLVCWFRFVLMFLLAGW